MKVESLDQTKLKDVGLDTCNHDIHLSSREVPRLDEHEPQLQPLPSCPSLDVSLGDERGLVPPIKQRSPDSFRMKCLFVRDGLNLANKLTAKEMSGLVQIVRYIRAPIALKYGTSGPRTSSSSSHGRNGSLSTLSDLLTIEVLKGFALSILNRFKSFSV
ncbi:hypothetical protein Tco_0343940 [Tanacetum coccineum]